jgi:all-trans-retinol dehydrogenase (NAD+)
MRNLADKRVLVTGGASGLGLAIARRFAAAGAQVILTDIDADALETAEAGLALDGVQVATYPMDVGAAESVTAARDRIHREGGPIDVLVNNAGVVFGGRFTDVALAHHLDTYRVNLLGAVIVTHAFLPDLVGRPEGHLVNIASASGLIALPYGSTYASSKWGLIGFSDSIRVELTLDGHRHVGVTTVCPSYVTTGLFAGARPPLTTRALDPDTVAALVVRAVRRNRPFVLTPWIVRITPALKGLLPARMFDAVARLLGATTSMRSWRGRNEN